MPQGFCNSPNVFQEMVERVLDGLKVDIYIDDVLIAPETEEEHLDFLEEVINRLTTAGFKIGLKKCEIGKSEVKIGTEERDISENYLEDLKEPNTVLETEQVLGKLEYVAAHIPHYAGQAKECHELKKGLRTRDGEKRLLSPRRNRPKF